MSIVAVPPPSSARRALSAAAGLFTSDVMTPANESALRSAADVEIGFRTFVMGGEDIRAGLTPNTAARADGWRFLLSRSRRGVVRVRETGGPEGHRFSDFNVGSYSQAAWEAIDEASSFATAHERPLEVTFLGVPTLYVETVWLRAQDGTDDYLLLYGKHPGSVREHVFYAATEFVRALRDVAAEKIDRARRFPSR